VFSLTKNLSTHEHPGLISPPHLFLHSVYAFLHLLDPHTSGSLFLHPGTSTQLPTALFAHLPPPPLPPRQPSRLPNTPAHGQKIANFFRSFAFPDLGVLADVLPWSNCAVPSRYVWMGLPITTVLPVCVMGNMGCRLTCYRYCCKTTASRT
jgi:hypothetical protein